jgi:[ribosomal protein S5]-alanine N-acetyltransferase
MSDVALRALSRADLAVLERFDTDPNALGEFEWQGFHSPVRMSKEWEENGLLSAVSGRLAVTSDGVAVTGIVSWRTVARGGPEGICFEVGVALLPEYRGQGIGTSAHRLLVDYLFAYTTVERLEALTDTENHAEQHVLERGGFCREGVLRHAVWQRGGWRDLVLYARLRDL